MADEAAQLAAIQQRSGLSHWACFFAEQAAQFAAKAMLHGLGSGGWGHDLVDLGERVATALDDPLPGPVSEAMLRLSRHYIATRYPDAHAGGTPGAHYGPADANQAVADAGVVLAFVAEHWTAVTRHGR